ncbi:hypothetical protein [Lewinella sp. W8]|uniref:hypothetical protein n=1 Tax=Lewinella sp. W8 TaxID=2528208 RepID=UPI001067EDDF|nr:hypothetical protein [Lewinella sp. W8]MTB49372.1 hypothetical protein [Lewinella sp. W8]
MNKNPIFFALLLLLCTCGTPRSSAPIQDNSTGETYRDTIIAPPITGGEGEVGSEEISTDQPVAVEVLPTRYAEFISRRTTSAPALPRANNACHLAVEVRGYEGEDGCDLLLETDAGNLFYVGAEYRGDPLEPGSRISIGFEYMDPDPTNTCTNVDATIRITCWKLLRVSSGIPRPIFCEAYDRPSQWLYDLAKDFSATYITRFPWKDDRYVYLLESPFGQYLFDCRGYQLCQPRKNCLGFIERIREGVVIWEG